MKRWVGLGLAVVLLIVAASCASQVSNTNTMVVSRTSAGKNLRLITVSSEKYYFRDKENEVVPEVLRLVNSGEYNIVKVETVYSASYLTAATITYNSAEEGEGNRLRLLLLLSDRYYWADKHKELLPKLEEAVNRGDLNIVDVFSVYAKGHLVAAEVYYLEE